jgi:hypothetical protein
MRSTRSNELQASPSTRSRGISRIVSLLLVAWLVIGAFAAYQRNYFDRGDTSCATVSTVALTVLAGPLNYLGVNPKIKECNAPKPSK